MFYLRILDTIILRDVDPPWSDKSISTTPIKSAKFLFNHKPKVKCSKNDDVFLIEIQDYIPMSITPSNIVLGTWKAKELDSDD